MTNETHPKVGIIIVTYNSESVIADCLTSLQSLTYPSYEIVVVDNNSSDTTVEKVKQFILRATKGSREVDGSDGSRFVPHSNNNHPIHIINNKKNLGYAGGNNAGIHYFVEKKFEYVLIINPDITVQPNLLEKLLEPFETQKRIGVTGPVITYAKNKGRIWFAGGKFHKVFCFTTHPKMNKLIKKTKIKSRDVDFITGVCMMVKTSVFKQVGLLPEKFFLYFEDAFFCQKLRKKKYRSFLVAEPLVTHQVSASTGKRGKTTLTKLRAYYYGRNPLWYIKYDVSGFLKITNYFGQFFIRLPYYILQQLKARNTTVIPSYMRGIRDGIFK